MYADGATEGVHREAGRLCTGRVHLPEYNREAYSPGCTREAYSPVYTSLGAQEASLRLISLLLRSPGGLFVPHYSLFLGAQEASLCLILPSLRSPGGLSVPHCLSSSLGAQEASLRLILFSLLGAQEASLRRGIPSLLRRRGGLSAQRYTQPP